MLFLQKEAETKISWLGGGQGVGETKLTLNPLAGDPGEHPGVSEGPSDTRWGGSPLSLCTQTLSSLKLRNLL